MKLSRKRLNDLRRLADENAIWTNTSWSAWPQGDEPKWAGHQFALARELIRLALIGIEHDK